MNAGDRARTAALLETDPVAARLALSRLWQTDPGAATAAALLPAVSELPQPVTCRLHLLRSCTVEPLLPLWQVAAGLRGIALQPTVGGYGSYAVELLQPGEWLAERQPDLVWLALDLADLAPELTAGPAAAALLTVAVERLLGDLTAWLQSLRAATTVPLVVQNFALPAGTPGGLQEWQQPLRSDCLAELNRGLRQLCGGLDDCWIADLEAVAADHGRRGWSDPQRRAAVGLPWTGSALVALAEAWARLLQARLGPHSKVLVCDLDGTLWQGVLGEDGIAGVTVNPPRVALQQAIADLARRGVLLAVASKNDPAEALAALDQVAGRRLARADFAAQRIGWDDKASSLRAIAAELGVGLDSLAFLDDHPAERAWVRQAAPEVHVIELADDPWQWAAQLRDDARFERLRLTAEDLARPAMLRQQQHRAALRDTADSLETYYRSLRMHARIAPLTLTEVTRVAQLTRKTNQFNLTTRRRSDAAVAALLDDPAWLVLTLRLTDRFGDSGLVGVAILERDPRCWRIDTLLLSCRVIGRTVETALLAGVIHHARRAGAGALVGVFIPSAKNEPAASCYPAHGFSPTAAPGEWSLDLTTQDLPAPPWIEVTFA
ncbi:MAG: HAD-IIIC family phosphatase [Fimbriimonadaceae bacterium]|nr:HAD-IIIC family phosphatase [Fimbriimonadaceae bacterium]